MTGDRGSPAMTGTRRTGSIRRRLIWSHLVAITCSTFVYAAGGFVLMVMILVVAGGYTPQGVMRLAPQFVGLTAFVLVQIFLITLCGVVVARIASSVASRTMLRQIAELESGSIDVAQGNLQRRVSIITDDELGRLAQRFNILAEHLDVAERQRSAFVANVSHDLRTPIAIIRGHLDAQMGGRSDTGISIEASLAAIDHEIETLSQLVNDLFSHSRLEEGVVPVTAVPVDIGTLVQRAVDGVRAYALTHARVSVHSQVPESIPAVVADRTKTVQVLNNLLHNAVRHTPEGGIVLAQAEVLPGEAWVRTSVRDTGVGIPASRLPYVFDRYYQAASKEDDSGSGLGLSIVRRLVELQGGRVGIESEVGVGTAVWFDLPVAVASSDTGKIRLKERFRVP
jgi:two-component system sensor histidine kinase BaeS